MGNELRAIIQFTKRIYREKKILVGSGTSGTATATRPSGSTGTGTGGSSKIYTNLDNLSNLTQNQQSALGIDIPEIFETDPVNAKLAKT